MAPGVYFRLLLIGYFEGIDSERGIAWRAQDSLALRRFLRVGLEESPPDHSTISRTRRLMDVETHREVFTWVLGVLAEKGLLKGKTLGIDATTLEANAALRTIVRRDTGEGYQEFLKRLAQESGIATPTREQLARLDRKRARKGSNEEWEHPGDGAGRGRRKIKRRSTPTGVGYRASAGSGYCGNAARSWNGALRTCMKRAGCGACICGGTRTFSSVCWCTSQPLTWGS